MLRSIANTAGAWARVARLLTAALVLGGVVLGPVAHVQVEGDAVASGLSDEGHAPGEAPVPDGHHDCPVCLTLASVAVPVVPPVPGSLLSDVPVTAPPATAAHDRAVSDTERARAPPIS